MKWESCGCEAVMDVEGVILKEPMTDVVNIFLSNKTKPIFEMINWIHHGNNTIPQAFSKCEHISWCYCNSIEIAKTLSDDQVKHIP